MPTDNPASLEKPEPHKCDCGMGDSQCDCGAESSPKPAESLLQILEKVGNEVNGGQYGTFVSHVILPIVARYERTPSPEPKPAESLLWRIGKQVPINVYEGDRPVCQCQTAMDAKRIVEAMNAETPSPEPARQPDDEVEWLCGLSASIREILPEANLTDEQIRRIDESVEILYRMQKFGERVYAQPASSPESKRLICAICKKPINYATQSTAVGEQGEFHLQCFPTDDPESKVQPESVSRCCNAPILVCDDDICTKCWNPTSPATAPAKPTAESREATKEKS